MGLAEDLRAIQQQNKGGSQQAPSADDYWNQAYGKPLGPQGETVDDPELAASLRNIQSQVQDDSWGANLKDFGVGIAQGTSYNWIDELLGGYGEDAYDIALQRNPGWTLGGEFLGGAATDIGLATAAGSTIAPGVGTVGGAAVGVGKAGLRFGRLANKFRNIHKNQNLAKRIGTYGGIGATHGAIAGAGSANQYGEGRLEGALEGAKYGAVLGGGIPVLGAGFRGASKAGKYALKKTLGGQPFRNAAGKSVADDIFNLYKNPQVTGVTVGNNFNDLVQKVGKAGAGKVNSATAQLDSQGIKVNIGGIRKQFGGIATKYDKLGRPDVGNAIRRSIGDRQNVNLSDARILQDNVDNLNKSGRLSDNDYNTLTQTIRREIDKGLDKQKGAKDFYHRYLGEAEELKKITQDNLFIRGLKDEGVTEGDISSILNSDNPLAGFNNYNKLFDRISKQTDKQLRGIVDPEELLQLQEDFRSLAINKLLSDNGKLLSRIANRTDRKEILEAITGGDKKVMGLLDEIISLRTKESTDTTADVIRTTLGGITGGSGIGFIAGGPGGALAGAILSQIPKLMTSVALKNSKVRSGIRKLLNSKSPTEAERYNQIVRSELLSAGIVLGGFGVYTASSI